MVKVVSSKKRQCYCSCNSWSYKYITRKCFSRSTKKWNKQYNNIETWAEKFGRRKRKRRKNVQVQANNGNRLVDWLSLNNVICDNAICRFCSGDLNIDESTVGIATEVILSCKSCDNVKKNFVRQSNRKKIPVKKTSSAAYSTNIQFVLALMQIGCGNAETQIMIDFLDLPHGHTY